MAKAATSSGAVNTKSGRALLSGRGGNVRSGGDMRSTQEQAGSGAVRLNGRMGVGSTSKSDLGFLDGSRGEPFPEEYAAGTKQPNIDPRKRGSVR